MSEMSEWIAQLTGGSRGVTARPVEKLPVTPEMTQAPIPQGSDTAAAPPATPGAMNPLLRNFLLQNQSGHNVLSDEMYDYFGGDAILEALRGYDPNASLEETQLAGENGGRGRRFNFDLRSLPGVTTPDGRQLAGNDVLGLHAMYDSPDYYKNPNMFFDDETWGRLTTTNNVKPQESKWWEQVAPLAVGLAAPWAAGALAGAGIGGTAGLTAGVTGSGVAAGAGAAPWWTKPLSKLPQIARSQAGGFNPVALGSMAVGAGANAFGIPSEYAQALSALTGVAGSAASNRNTYNPQAMARQGSPKKSNNGSSLVANQFAPGAYRNSNPWGYNNG